MKMRKLTAALLAVMMILSAMVLAACGSKAEDSADGDDAASDAPTMSYTLEVVSKDGTTKTYEAATTQEFLQGAMDELVAAGDFSYEEESGMILTINGERADYNEDGAYWAIYVNGEYGQFGAAEQPIADGDVYRFEYTPA